MPLENLDWSGFLARPSLAAPPDEQLSPLRAAPILITGAGGSIGSRLALRLARIAPRLILLDASESHLFALQRALSEGATGPCCQIVPVLGGVGDAGLLDEIFAVHKPRLVLHAAAFKHVPLMEEQPLAAIANNVFATETLVSCAAANMARVVLLSTDKAVEPGSVMGATKRVAERLVLARGGVALRLGNVLASRDSVAEVFARQIAQGGPLTVTSPAARRYFLTLSEAANLLLAVAAQGAPGGLFAPRLPAPHRIAALAQFMAATLAPGREIPLLFTAPRAGDKESEALWGAGEFAVDSGIAALLRIGCAPTPGSCNLEALRQAVAARDLEAALAALCGLVPLYTPSAAVTALARQQQRTVCP